MSCGVLEDHKLSHVPGTAIFSEDANAAALAAYEGIDLTLLQRSATNPDIILVPQPSTTDLNDPLLWPKWKKNSVFVVLVFGTCLVGAVGPLVSADQSHIAVEFGVSNTDMARVLSSYFVLVLGIATLFFQVGSVKFGKRPIYLGTSILLCGSTVWASYATSLGSFAGARVPPEALISVTAGSNQDYSRQILMGIAAAPLEFLVGASINDIYYVHERGLPVALWNLALINGIFAVAVGVLTILQFWLMPETTFVRQSIPVLSSPEGSATGSEENKEKPPSPEHVEFESGRGSDMISARGFAAGLKPWSGIYKTRSNPLTLFMRPLLMLFTPLVFWGGILYGMAITYLVVLAVSISVIFAYPPYNFSAGSVGLAYLGPFVGALMGSLIAGPLTSMSARILSRRNRGTYEPEFKLIPGITLYLLFGVMGFVGYGWTLHNGTIWIGPVIFFAISNFAIVLGSTAAVSYIIDSHRHTTDAALGALIFWKNIWSFGLTWNLVAQVVQYGTKNVFGIVAALVSFACLVTIPLYIYGKRLRSFVHRHLSFNEEEELSVVAR
ncbi:hypothetical protein P7C70_g5130, partial [Phenoliferia sp. Uapishka_3]